MKILLVYLKEDEKLEKCLNSLKKYSPDLEVVKHKTSKKETKIAEEIYNKVIDDLNDDVIIWHPDMYATENWYENLKKYYDSFDVIGLKLLYPNGLVHHYGGAIRADGVGIHPHQHTLNFGLNQPLETAFVTGPSMLIKKHVWEKVGKFDTNYSYCVDSDWCFRAREKGFSIGVVPVEIIHEEGADGVRTRPKQETLKLQTESRNRFVSKWMSVLSDKINEIN